MHIAFATLSAIMSKMHEIFNSAGASLLRSNQMQEQLPYLIMEEWTVHRSGFTVNVIWERGNELQGSNVSLQLIQESVIDGLHINFTYDLEGLDLDISTDLHDTRQTKGLAPHFHQLHEAFPDAEHLKTKAEAYAIVEEIAKRMAALPE